MYKPMSAFGISVGESATNSDNCQPEAVNTMNSFANALRTRRRNSTAASSIYSEQRSPELNKVSARDYQNLVVGYEQGTAYPYAMDRAEVMVSSTRKGVVQHSNPYRLPGVDDDGYGPTNMLKQENNVNYHAPVVSPPAPKQAPRQRRPVPAVKQSRSVTHSHPDHVARKQGKDDVPPQDLSDAWKYIDRQPKPSTSKSSPYDSDSPPRQTGLFRSFSSKVKGSLRRRRQVVEKDQISAPFNDMKRESPGPTMRTTPIRNPAPELSGRRPARQSSNHYPNAFKARPARPKVPEKLAVPPAPRKVKVVGADDQITLFGDMIDAFSQSDSSSERDVGYGKFPDDGDFGFIDIEPPPPLNVCPARKPLPSKRVDTSKYDWVPPTLPTPVRVTSQHDWRMDEEYPTTDSLFDEIDEQIAEMSIAEEERPAARREAHRLDRMLDRLPPGTIGVDDEDAEPEVIVDTFMRDGHSSWVATERPNSQTATSSHHRFKNETYDVSAERDEAAKLMERLRKVRAGEMF